MRKKGLILIVALLCVASLMAAMAYSTAYVQNPTTLKIASTDSALIQIVPGTGVGNKDATAYVENGVMNVDFGRGRGGQIFGLQPASAYTWDNLFSVTNNSEENLNYRITVGNDEIVKHLTITDTTTGQVVFNQSNASAYVDFPSGSTHTFKVQIWLHQITPLADLSGTIQFNTYAK